jgi:hypothetical protein
MATTIVTRGTTIEFSSLFYTASGTLTSPTNAAVYINYPTTDGGGVNSTTSVTMTQVGSAWTASWQSYVARPGTAFWTVVSSGTSPYTREDGQLKLTANPANPD